MLDVIMLAVLSVSFGALALLVRWCGRQVDSDE